jgi:hypothetical protein
MVKEKIEKLTDLKSVLDSFQLLIQESSISSDISSSAKEYNIYFTEKYSQIIEFSKVDIDSDGSEIYYLVGAISRYFHEFNWTKDMKFYREAIFFFDKMNSLATDILNIGGK